MNFADTNIRLKIDVGGSEPIVLVLRRSSAQQVSKFLDRRFTTRRNKMVNRSVSARIEFIDSLLIDVENLSVRDAAGEAHLVCAAMEMGEADQARWSELLNDQIRTFRDFIAVNWKSTAAMRFEDRVDDDYDDEDAEGN